MGAVGEFVSFAVELPDKRVCVLTPQRLVMLSADATTLMDSHWTHATGNRYLALHKGHILVADGQGIDILRITESGFEAVSKIEIRYAYRSPLFIADDKLFLIQAGRDFNIFSLADLAAPEHLREIHYENTGSNITLHDGRLFVGTRGALVVYDTQGEQLGRVEWPITRTGAMHVIGDTLYATAEGVLHSVDISDLDDMSVTSGEEESLGPAEFAIPRANGFDAFSGYSRTRVTFGADGPSFERDSDVWPIVAKDADSVRDALFGTGFWTRRPMQGAARIDQHLVLFDGKNARIYDIADFAKPRLVSSLPFAGTIARPVVHGSRIFVPGRGLNLANPTAPEAFEYGRVTFVKLDGDLLYIFYGRKVTTFSVADGGLEEVGEVTIPRFTGAVMVHGGHFFYSDGGELKVAKPVEGELQIIGELDLGGENSRANAFWLEDDLLYVGTYYGGLRLVDVIDPTAPRFLTGIRERERYDNVVGLAGMVFASRGSRQLVSVNLRRKPKVIERGPWLGRGYLEIMGDHLLGALPEAGVGLFDSKVLESTHKQMQKQAPARARLAKNPDSTADLSKLALIADKQGDIWTAERSFLKLQGRELDEETAAALAEFLARKKAAEEAAAAARAFMADLQARRGADIERNDSGEIVRLRVFAPPFLRRHKAHIATLPLKNLDLSPAPFGADDLAILAQLPSLEYLRIRGLDVDAAGLAPLATLKKLEILNLEGAKLPAGGLAHIANLPSLTYLDIESTGVGDDELVHLAGISTLQTLDLEYLPITDAGLVHLRELRKLKNLRLANCKIDGSGLVNIAHLSSLESLDMEYAKATQFEGLAGLKNLENLDVHGTGITDAGMAHISGMKRLEDLRLDNTAVTTEGIAHIVGLSALTRLDLSDTKIDDGALALIGGMNNLEKLNLRSTGVSDDGVTELKNLHALEWIGVENVPDFSDDGLEAFAGLKSLERVTARGTSVSAVGVALLGDVQVDWKQAQEKQAEPEEGEREEMARIAAMPAKLSFDIVENHLRLLDAENGKEYRRETPQDLFGFEAIELRMVVPWDGLCWLASDRGLLRFEPRERVWSRFAIDREHLDVNVTGLSIADGVLEVAFGQAQSARFSLAERRWLTAAVAPPPVAAVAPATVASTSRLSWAAIAGGVFALLLCTLLLRKVVGRH